MKRVLDPDGAASFHVCGEARNPNEKDSCDSITTGRNTHGQKNVQKYRHHVALDGCRDGLDVAIADTWYVQHYQ